MDVFTSMSLCSGYEGLGIGLKRAISNLRTICYVENEAYAIANLVAKIKEKRLDDAPIWDDLKTFDPKPFIGLVDIIHSGFPCQPFSVAGKRKGTDDPRWLWPHIARIVQTVKPVWCYFENVPGHLSLGFPTVYRSLRDMGYSVEAGLFTAAEVGAPHRRQRLFILAKSREYRWGGGDNAESTRQGRTLQTTRPSELGDTALALSTRKQQFRNNVSLPPSKELAHTERSEGRLLLRERQPQQSRTDSERGGETMADPETTIGRGTEETGRPNRMWPARPGQPQYEWEEPRTMADTRKFSRSKAATGKPDEARGVVIARSSRGQTQSRLG